MEDSKAFEGLLRKAALSNNMQGTLWGDDDDDAELRRIMTLDDVDIDIAGLDLATLADGLDGLDGLDGEGATADAVREAVRSAVVGATADRRLHIIPWWAKTPRLNPMHVHIYLTSTQ